MCVRVHKSISVPFTHTTLNMLRTRRKREMDLSSIAVQEKRNTGSSSIAGKAKGLVSAVLLAKNLRPGAQWGSLW